MLMPLLALTAVLTLIPVKAPASILWFVTLALIFGTVGDVFLLDAKNNKRFLAGTASFFTGHLFYLFIFAPAIFKLPSWSWIIALPLSVAFTYVSWLAINRPKGITAVFIWGYTFILCMMVFSGVAGISSLHASPYSFVLAGAIMFIVSDGILSMTLYKKDFSSSRFVIMITYIAAEALLVLGACGLYVSY